MAETNKDEWVIRWKEFRTYHKKVQAANDKKYLIMSEEEAARIEAAIEADEVTEWLIEEIMSE